MTPIVMPAAVKALAALPRQDRAALIGKIEEFAAEPFAGHAWAVPLKGRSDAVRLRHGNWRAVCRIDRSADTVIVEAVAHRREVYR